MATETADLADALERARSGDEAGFLELWRALQPRLLRYLRVLSCGDAEDVASETWLQVVRDLHRFSGSEDDFRRWLFTVGGTGLSTARGPGSGARSRPCRRTPSCCPTGSRSRTRSWTDCRLARRLTC